MVQTLGSWLQNILDIFLLPFFSQMKGLYQIHVFLHGGSCLLSFCVSDTVWGFGASVLPGYPGALIYRWISTLRFFPKLHLTCENLSVVANIVYSFYVEYWGLITKTSSWTDWCHWEYGGTLFGKSPGSKLLVFISLDIRSTSWSTGFQQSFIAMTMGIYSCPQHTL